jgi:farnesyl diphosphate synthase
MCGGQMLDLQGEVDPQDLDGVMLTQRMKTGALFEFACSAACHLSERGMAARPDLREFARCFGLAFQIRDDILDETGDETAMGKDLGRDAASNKSTMVSHLGIDGANGRLAALRAEAGSALDRLPGDVSLLRALMDASISRTS